MAFQIIRSDIQKVNAQTIVQIGEKTEIKK